MTHLNSSCCLGPFLLDLQKITLSISTVKVGTNEFECRAGASVSLTGLGGKISKEKGISLGNE